MESPTDIINRMVSDAGNLRVAVKVNELTYTDARTIYRAAGEAIADLRGVQDLLNPSKHTTEWG